MVRSATLVTVAWTTNDQVPIPAHETRPDSPYQVRLTCKYHANHANHAKYHKNTQKHAKSGWTHILGQTSLAILTPFTPFWSLSRPLQTPSQPHSSPSSPFKPIKMSPTSSGSLFCPLRMPPVCHSSTTPLPLVYHRPASCPLQSTHSPLFVHCTCLNFTAPNTS